MVKDIANKTYLTPKEAAEFLNVSTETIRVWSNKGKLKSTVTLGGHRRFNQQDLQEFSRQLQTGQICENQKQSLKILIIEKDIQYANLLYKFITDFSDNIVAETAHEVFDAGCKIINFNPSVIILDLTMPGINGTDVCRQLKSNSATKSIRIISVVKDDSEINAQSLLDAGSETILMKPIDMEKLKCLLLNDNQ